MRTVRSKAVVLVCIASTLLGASALGGCTPADDGGDVSTGGDARSSTSPSAPQPGAATPSAPGGDPSLAGAKYFASFSFQVAKGASASDGLHYSAGALFADRDPFNNPVGCEEPEIIGACTVRRCPMPQAGQQTAPTYDSLPAGDVSVATPAGSTALAVEPTGLWVAKSLAAWAPGDLLTAKVTGAPGGAPAFELSTTAPPPLTMTSPTLPTSVIPTPIKHAKSSDLAAQWGEAGAGRGVITVSGASGGKILSVMCGAELSEKQVSVPASILARFDSPRVMMSLEASSYAMKRQGEWAIGVFARALARTPAGADAKTFVELQ